MVNGQAKSKKITCLKNFPKTIPYFFPVVSRPLRRVVKAFSEKNSKKKMCNKFCTIFFGQRFLDFLRCVVGVIWSFFLEVCSSRVLEEISQLAIS